MIRWQLAWFSIDDRMSKDTYVLATMLVYCMHAAPWRSALNAYDAPSAARKMVVNRRLLPTACLLVSSKLLDTYCNAVPPGHWARRAGDTFTAPQLLEMEAAVVFAAASASARDPDACSVVALLSHPVATALRDSAAEELLPLWTAMLTSDLVLD